MISRDFKIAVKLADIPAWKIAYRAGVNPNVLSKIMSGALRVKDDDPRVLKIGAVLGLKQEECFAGNVNGNEGDGRTFAGGQHDIHLT